MQLEGLAERDLSRPSGMIHAAKVDACPQETGDRDDPRKMKVLHALSGGCSRAAPESA